MISQVTVNKSKTMNVNVLDGTLKYPNEVTAADLEVPNNLRNFVYLGDMIYMI